jgi:uncharacterized protein (TIGR01777 family)
VTEITEYKGVIGDALGPAAETKRLILAGGSGFLGRALAAYFLRAGWEVVILTRSPGRSGGMGREVAWDARNVGPWQKELDGAAAIVNLTGKSVDCRYTAHNRKEIMESRVDSTRVLGYAIGRCSRPPLVWLNASTATIYRHTFDGAWDESGEIKAMPEAKDAFSVEVATAWERTLDAACTPNTRKIAMRTAMVLGTGRNSVFPVLRRLVRLGLGGRMGSGRQFVSWIHELDFCRTVEWLIAHHDLRGAINIAAPNPVTNRDMMSILRHVCRMPFGLPSASWMLEVGAFFLRTETELIIKSRRVVPGRLIESGFEFQFPTIREAFENLSCYGR